MSFPQQVQQIRTSANSDVLAAILASLPDPDAIQAREHLHELLWPELSTSDEIRRQQIPAVLRQYQEQLDGYHRRYNQLRTEGLSALSDYDLGIAYRGIGPERGLASALGLVANHIACTRAQVLWLLAEQTRLTPPQLALF